MFHQFKKVEMFWSCEWKGRYAKVLKVEFPGSRRKLLNEGNQSSKTTPKEQQQEKVIRKSQNCLTDTNVEQMAANGSFDFC